jgi:hypothetical protein
VALSEKSYREELMFPTLPYRLKETLLKRTMRRISDVDKKKSARSIRPKGASTLFSVKSTKSTAILPEASLRRRSDRFAINLADNFRNPFGIETTFR